MEVNMLDLYVDPEDRRREQVLLKQKGSVRDFEMRLRQHDGSVIWVRETARAGRNVRGHAVYYEGSLENVTEYVRSEGERTRAEERVAHLNAVLRAIRSVNREACKECQLCIKACPTSAMADHYAGKRSAPTALPAAPASRLAQRRMRCPGAGRAETENLSQKRVVYLHSTVPPTAHKTLFHFELESALSWSVLVVMIAGSLLVERF